MVSKETADLLLKVGVVGAGVGIAYYAVTQILKPFSFGTGGDCTDPKTPCGAAMAPLVAQLQQCTGQYLDLTSTIARQPGGATQGQLQGLDAYRKCIDDTMPQIAQTAASFSVNNIFDTVAAIAGIVGAEAIFLKYGAGFIAKLQSLKSKPTTGATHAANVFNASILSEIQLGNISPTTGGNLAYYLQTNLGTVQADDYSGLVNYASLNLISLTQAQQMYQLVDAPALATDFAYVQTFLPPPIPF